MREEVRHDPRAETSERIERSRHAMLSYSTKGAPRNVELKWTLFNEKVTTA